MSKEYKQRYATEDYVAEEVAKLPQTDWNQNDETAPSFIKNRPFGVEEEVFDVVQEEITITLDANGRGYYDGTWYPNSGVIYGVEWNGVLYKGIAYDDSDECGVLDIVIDGETVRFYESGTIFATSNFTGDHIFSIAAITENVKKIDEKYLPDAVAEVPYKMDKIDPVGRGSFSMNRIGGPTIGNYSSTLGKDCSAAGMYSISAGLHSEASNQCAIALGNTTTASGEYSTAIGYYVQADGDYSFVIGKFSPNDSESKYIFRVGNGANGGNRTNAHTLDWEGNAWYSGDVYVGSTSGVNKDEGSKKLATEEYVDTKISNFTLTDEATSKKYKLTVINGNLTMTEVES